MALTGRLMQRGGWVGGARQAGAEPLCTGRSRPYDESTLRKTTRELARQGATDIVARVVEAMVQRAVEAARFLRRHWHPALQPGAFGRPGFAPVAP